MTEEKSDDKMSKTFVKLADSWDEVRKKIEYVFINEDSISPKTIDRFLYEQANLFACVAHELHVKEEKLK